MVSPRSTSSRSEPAIGRWLPGGKTSDEATPEVAITCATPPSARTIAVRSNGTSPRSSRMKAPKASSRSSEDPSALAQPPGLGSLHPRQSRLVTEPADEPADDQPGQQKDPEREAHAVRAERRRAEAVGTPPLEEHECREEEERNDDAPAPYEAKRRLDDREDECPPCRASVLVREEERVA